MTRPYCCCCYGRQSCRVVAAQSTLEGLARPLRSKRLVFIDETLDQDHHGAVAGLGLERQKAARLCTP